MLGTHAVVAFIATRDGVVARQFYEKTLGLRLISDEPWVLVFDANGTTLRIQKVDAFTPFPFTALGWTVPSIEALVGALEKQGIKLERYDGMKQDARGIWRSPSGARVAWFKDPDGNTLSVTELG
ncbi:MAG TPA: VOC family protein [Polyangiaceae bacterium]|jgi:catechol 2,3-dioxygenase-like lactoylglutathione lyase family enzyme